MAHTTFQIGQTVGTATPLRLSPKAFGLAIATFVAISFLLCMLLGLIAPDWGLHKPWLQFYFGMTGFDLRSVVLGVFQSLILGGYTGLLVAFLFNVFSRWIG